MRFETKQARKDKSNLPHQSMTVRIINRPNHNIFYTYTIYWKGINTISVLPAGTLHRLR
jgi:hypothetical protein